MPSQSTSGHHRWPLGGPTPSAMYGTLIELWPSQIESQEAPAMTNNDPITLYTTSWCPDCRMVKRYFKDHEIAYTEVDIEHDAAAMEQVLRWNNGRRSVPTFQYAGKILAEPSRAELDALFRPA